MLILLSFSEIIVFHKGIKIGCRRSRGGQIPKRGSGGPGEDPLKPTACVLSSIVFLGVGLLGLGVVFCFCAEIRLRRLHSFLITLLKSLP